MCKSGLGSSIELKGRKVLVIAGFYKILHLSHFFTSSVLYV